MSDVIPASQPL